MRSGESEGGGLSMKLAQGDLTTLGEVQALKTATFLMELQVRFPGPYALDLQNPNLLTESQTLSQTLNKDALADSIWAI